MLSPIPNKTFTLESQLLNKLVIFQEPKFHSNVFLNRNFSFPYKVSEVHNGARKMSYNQEELPLIPQTHTDRLGSQAQQSIKKVDTGGRQRWLTRQSSSISATFS